jgi:hypothetical protein
VNGLDESGKAAAIVSAIRSLGVMSCQEKYCADTGYRAQKVQFQHSKTP